MVCVLLYSLKEVISLKLLQFSKTLHCICVQNNCSGRSVSLGRQLNTLGSVCIWNTYQALAYTLLFFCSIVDTLWPWVLTTFQRVVSDLWSLAILQPITIVQAKLVQTATWQARAQTVCVGVSEQLFFKTRCVQFPHGFYCCHLDRMFDANFCVQPNKTS